MKKLSTSLRGIYRDVLTGPDRRIIHDSGWVSNTIVNDCRVLLAAFLKNEISGGIHHLAVGQGDDAWDDDGFKPSELDRKELVQAYDEEYILVTDTEGTALTIEYLDENDEVVLDDKTVTSRLEITTTLAPGYPAPPDGQKSYPLREFGLFGGGAKGSRMINCVRHPVIHKHETNTLVRVIRLYL